MEWNDIRENYGLTPLTVDDKITLLLFLLLVLFRELPFDRDEVDEDDDDELLPKWFPSPSVTIEPSGVTRVFPAGEASVGNVGEVFAAVCTPGAMWPKIGWWGWWGLCCWWCVAV